MALNEDPQILQKKLYFLLEQLQNMARDIPLKYQMRLPYELLASLANCLLNETVFDIVKGLLEIQHFTEQHLHQTRLAFIQEKKVIKKNIINFRQINKTNKISVQEHEILKKFENNPGKKIEALQKFMLEQKEQLKIFDTNLVLQLDQKVTDQQHTLEQAGVPGFYVTSNPLEIKVQIYLLDFILRLSRMPIPEDG